MSDRIDLNEKYNQALSIVLFDKLKGILNAHFKESIDYNAKDYTDKINELVIENYSDENIYEVKVDKLFPQIVLRVFKYKPLTDTYKTQASFKKETLNKFTNILKYHEGINYGWDTFKEDFKKEAEEELKNNPTRYGITCIDQNPKIYFGINVMCFFCEKDKFKEEIKNVIQRRIKSDIGKKSILFDFGKEGEDIEDLEHAKRIGMEKGMDLVMYADAAVDAKEQISDQLKMKLHYAITNPIFLERFSSCDSVFSHTGKSEFSITSIADLYEGHLQSDIDQTIYLILALYFYLGNDPKKALDFLEKVIKEKRCDETWFIMGVCHFELHSFAKAKECWEKTLERNEGLLKARKNLAILYLQPEFKKEYNEDFKEIIEGIIGGDWFKESSEEFFLPLAILFDEIGKSTLAKEYFKKVIEIREDGRKDYAYLRLADLSDAKLENLVKAAKISTNLEIHEQCVIKINELNISTNDTLEIFKKIRNRISSRRINGETHKSILKLYNINIEEYELKKLIPEMKLSIKRETHREYVNKIYKSELPMNEKLIILSSIQKVIDRTHFEITRIYENKISLIKKDNENFLPVPKTLNDYFNDKLDNGRRIMSHFMPISEVGELLSITRNNPSKEKPLLFLSSLTLKSDDLKYTNKLQIQFGGNRNQIIETSKVDGYSYQVKRKEIINIAPINTTSELFLSVSFSDEKNDKPEFIQWKSLRIFLPDLEVLIKECRKFRIKLNPKTMGEFRERLYSLLSNSFRVNYVDFQLWFMRNFN